MLSIILLSSTLQATNISHLGKRKSIFKSAFFQGDILVPEGFHDPQFFRLQIVRIWDPPFFPHRNQPPHHERPKLPSLQRQSEELLEPSPLVILQAVHQRPWSFHLMASQPTPPLTYHPPHEIKAYSPWVSLYKALLNPCFWGEDRGE